MNAHDLRQLDVPELEAKVMALEEELFRLRIRHATAQLANTAEIRQARRTVARAKTVLAEKRRAAAAAPAN